MAYRKALGHAFGLVVCLILLFASADILPEGWGWVGAVVAGILALGFGVGLVDDIRHRHADSLIRATFPGFVGERFPICDLLRYEGPEGAAGFDPAREGCSIGVSPNFLFPIRNASRSLKAGGSLIVHPATSQPLAIRKDEVATVSVLALSDEQIADNARDKRGDTEKVIEALALKAFDLSHGMKTVPYAAFVIVDLARAAGPARLVIGVPTEIEYDTLEALGEETTANFGIVDALEGKAKGFVDSKMQGAAEAVVGEAVVGAVMEAQDILTSSRPTGSTDGSQGRSMAGLIARRLRRAAALA
jgi:hypothetical protein